MKDVFIYASAACAALLVSNGPVATQSSTMESHLRALAEGRGSREGFSVVYNDLHGLHGGLKLTVHGNGDVNQEAVRIKPHAITKLTPGEVRELIELLIELRAWEQRTPERMAAPDESRANLAIRVGTAESSIWEWHNDLARNNRIARIREAMLRLAAPPHEHPGSPVQTRRAPATGGQLAGRRRLHALSSKNF